MHLDSATEPARSVSHLLSSTFHNPVSAEDEEEGDNNFYPPCNCTPLPDNNKDRAHRKKNCKSRFGRMFAAVDRRSSHFAR